MSVADTSNLYVGFVSVGRIRELRLFAGDIGENDILFEQKHLEFLWLLH